MSAPKKSSSATVAGPGVQDGARCTVVAGTHKGKSGVVRDMKQSKTGAVTITVVQADGERFKTLAKSVLVSHD
jgi:ribosomal protein S4E